MPLFEHLKVRAYDESMEMFTAAQSDPNMGDLHLDRPGVIRCPLEDGSKGENMTLITLSGFNVDDNLR